MSHVFYTCVVPHHGNCEGSWSDPFHGSHLRVRLWDLLSPRVSYVSIPHVEYVRQGYTPFKRRVSEVGRCPCRGLSHGSIVNGNVCGRFRDVLAQKARCVLRSSVGTLTSFHKSLSEH
jgi:hypothetical protein